MSTTYVLQPIHIVNYVCKILYPPLAQRKHSHNLIFTSVIPHFITEMVRVYLFFFVLPSPFTMFQMALNFFAIHRVEA